MTDLSEHDEDGPVEISSEELAAVPDTELPTVVIIGRPNVGKSTLFNRVVGSQQAIVEDRPGITRDRKVLEASWLEVPFLVVDTGGWMPDGDALDAKVSRQVEEAVREADVVLFVVDGSVGLTDDDQAIANWVRRSERDVIVVANKADNERRETDRWEFLSLGLGDPVPVSALHGRRAGDLLDVVIERFPEEARRVPDRDDDDQFEEGETWDDDDIVPPRVAIIGRPNVGKSTLFNRLVGEDRAVVHDMAGTTRDAIDTLVETEDGPMVFIDTAGMRRKGRIDDSAEYYSMVRALRALDDADVALLVIDGTEGVTSQDQRLAERIDASGCPILIVLNKWELVGTEERLDVLAELQRRLAFVGDVPILKISALTGKNVDKLRPHLQESIAQYHTRVPTRDVNKVIAAAQQRAPAPKGAKILYAVQGAIDPPTFTLFVNKELQSTYLRYIERTIREEFGLGSTAIKIRVRKKS
ncbi:MAG: ribosome biogenesis GTPase Der [Ilumatobacter sp.]|uniref:ribosome biogenesis GTPase Der n=1 Tax=Ilumatobacter sp. TaxID=1967498 RepID=UPI00391AC210